MCCMSIKRCIKYAGIDVHVLPLDSHPMTMAPTYTCISKFFPQGAQHIRRIYTVVCAPCSVIIISIYLPHTIRQQLDLCMC